MENRFEKYLMFKKENGKIVSTNPKAFELADESFLLFKELYDLHYDGIQEEENLISIHTGGWSENEALIDEFKQTAWWFMYNDITARGGDYYFDIDFFSKKKWNIKAG